MPAANEIEPNLNSEFNIEVEATEFVEDFGLEEFQAMGIDPIIPTEAKPGSEQKVLMLSARYAAGLPLWHDGDCYDHGPGGQNGELDYEEIDSDPLDLDEEEAV